MQFKSFSCPDKNYGAGVTGQLPPRRLGSGNTRPSLKSQSLATGYVALLERVWYRWLGSHSSSDEGIWKGPLPAMLGLMPLTYPKQHLMHVHLQKHVWKVLGKFQWLALSALLCPVFSSMETQCGNGYFKQELVQICATLFPTSLLTSISGNRFQWFQLRICTIFQLMFYPYSVYYLSLQINCCLLLSFAMSSLPPTYRHSFCKNSWSCEHF